MEELVQPKSARLLSLCRLAALAHRVIDNLAVIESEIQVFPICNELHIGGIISSMRIVAGDIDPVGDAYQVPPRVAMRIGIDSNERQVDSDQTGFLSELARGRALGRLAVFDVSAGQRILTAEGRISPSNKEQPAAGIEHDAVDSERWMFGVHECRWSCW